MGGRAVVRPRRTSQAIIGAVKGAEMAAQAQSVTTVVTEGLAEETEVDAPAAGPRIVTVQGAHIAAVAGAEAATQATTKKLPRSESARKRYKET